MSVWDEREPKAFGMNLSEELNTMFQAIEP